MVFFFFFQAEDGIRDGRVTGVQTCALPISARRGRRGKKSTSLQWGTDGHAPGSLDTAIWPQAWPGAARRVREPGAAGQVRADPAAAAAAQRLDGDQGRAC